MNDNEVAKRPCSDWSDRIEVVARQHLYAVRIISKQYIIDENANAKPTQREKTTRNIHTKTKFNHFSFSLSKTQFTVFDLFVAMETVRR